MQVIIPRAHRHNVSNIERFDVPLHVFLKEIDPDESVWYLVEADYRESRAYDTDKYAKEDKRYKRPYVSPDFKGIKNHNATWVRGDSCQEIGATNNQEALYLLRRD